MHLGNAATLEALILRTRTLTLISNHSKDYLNGIHLKYPMVKFNNQI